MRKGFIAYCPDHGSHGQRACPTCGREAPGRISPGVTRSFYVVRIDDTRPEGTGFSWGYAGANAEVVANLDAAFRTRDYAEAKRLARLIPGASVEEWADETPVRTSVPCSPGYRCWHDPLCPGLCLTCRGSKADPMSDGGNACLPCAACGGRGKVGS